MTDEIDWTTGYVTKDSALSIGDIKPNYNMTFHNNGKQVGAIDWNGPEMTFTGDVDESARMFFDWIAEAFKGRLEQERAAERAEMAKHCAEITRAAVTKAVTGAVALEREACAKVCDEQVERSKKALAKAKRGTDQAAYCSGAQTAAWNAAAIRARKENT